MDLRYFKPVLARSILKHRFPKRIAKIHFGILDAKTTQSISEVQITRPEIYDQQRRPRSGGVLDPRLGVSDKAHLCETCGATLAECPGHFGFIRLALPVFHAGQLQALTTLLAMVCKDCQRIMLTPRERTHLQAVRRGPTKAIMAKVAKLARNRSICPNCGSPNGPVKKVSALKLVHERAKSGNARMLWEDTFKHAAEKDPEVKEHLSKVQDDIDPIRARQILGGIPDEDLPYLGMITGRPEDLVLTVMPVPPACLRPSVVSMRGSTEDDLTVQMSEILHLNSSIAKMLAGGAKPHQLATQWDFLGLAVAKYLLGSLPPGTPLSVRLDSTPIRGVCTRLKGKYGRFRGNLSGKRVDFSGRTVIGPDPNLAVNEVGVPKLMAINLTFPEHVNKLNIRWLRKLVKAGPDCYPGANNVISGNRKMFLGAANRDFIADRLRPGDIVERHMHNGDLVLFNRQPSLHRLSIMGHRARVLPGRTLRFNECVCAPYNADFDGDEMNIHLPQTQEARAEVQTLLGVEANLVSPKNGDGVIGLTQDFLIGAYLLTHKRVFLDKAEFQQLCAAALDADTFFEVPPPAIVFPVKRWTGKQVISVLLHPNSKDNVLVNLSQGDKSYRRADDLKAMSLRDDYVVIRNSQHLSGRLTKTLLSGSKKGIFYFIHRTYRPSDAAARMLRFAKVTSRYLQNHGFSIGIDDVTPGNTLRSEKDVVVQEGYKECEVAIKAYESGNLQPDPGLSRLETLEQRLNGMLSQIRETCGQACLNNLHWSNSPLIMSACGAKGSPVNISQMMACVGQQTLNGKRAPDGFGDRTLPHFQHHSKTPQAKGFVVNSFFTGLEPHEYLFHTMAGREGLCDTAIKSVTADTEIVVMESGVCRRVQIGPWIDSHLETARLASAPCLEQYGSEQANMELLHVHDKAMFIPTVDEDGFTSWGALTAVTRHDPGDMLYRIKTVGGKEVTVTAAKSLIVWSKPLNKLVEKRVPDISVGDMLPITSFLPPPPDVATHIDIDIATDSTSTSLPEKSFELNYDNGVFIGLYLADGGVTVTTDEGNADVCIINSDKDIVAWIQRWFRTTMGIDSCVERTDTSTTVVGSSVILADFLSRMCGADSSSKIVPPECFAACDDHVKGILSGYMCGVGTDITESSIESSSSSADLTRGIAMLCSRLGIYGKESCVHDKHALSIRGQWAKKFVDTVPLMLSAKQRALDILNPSETHDRAGFDEFNNVALDSIESITEVSPALHPHMYDVTVPSTLNFGLSNGLMVRDTADTGYMQRRLMKCLEDLTVRYDFTVRNAEERLVQLSFGDDGLDPIHMEAELSPCNFTAMLYHIKQILPPKGSLEFISRPLEPQEIIEQIENGLTTPFLGLQPLPIECEQMRRFAALLAEEVRQERKAMRLVAGEPLNAEQLLCHLTAVYRHQVKELCLSARLKFARAQAEPGTSSGALAGQSIGEPATQMSVPGTTEVMVRRRGSDSDSDGGVSSYESSTVAIGALIDAMMLVNTDAVINTDVGTGHISSILNLSPSAGLQVPALGADEKIRWRNVKQLSRHHPNGQLLRITTRTGREITATPTHSFVVRRDNSVVPVAGSTLAVGDRLPVVSSLPEIELKCSDLDIDRVPGFNDILTVTIGDLFTLTSSPLFAAHGAMSIDARKTESIKLIDRSTLKEYITTFDEALLQIPQDESLQPSPLVQAIRTNIGVLRQAASSDVVWDPITSIDLVTSPTDHVYDFAVDVDETFTLSNGLVTHNTLKTFHFAGVASMNITLGVPRIKEIINGVRKISTPIVRAKLNQSDDIRAARLVKGRLERSSLGQLSSRISEHYTIGDCHLEIELDTKAITEAQLPVTFESVVNACVGTHTGLKRQHLTYEKSGLVMVHPPSADRESMFFSLQSAKVRLPDVTVCGIPSISRAVISADGQVPPKYELLAEGTGLDDVMITPGVDAYNTLTNNVLEVLDILGVEAARNTIIREISSTLGAHGMSVDIRHILLLADVMTNAGQVLGITRFGLSKMKEDSVLMLASFERTTDHLFQAALAGKSDAVAGVSECVIMGMPIPLGTGAFGLLRRPVLTKKGEQWQFQPEPEPSFVYNQPTLSGDQLDMSFWFESERSAKQHARKLKEQRRKRRGRGGGRGGRGRGRR